MDIVGKGAKVFRDGKLIAKGVIKEELNTCYGYKYRVVYDTQIDTQCSECLFNTLDLDDGDGVVVKLDTSQQDKQDILVALGVLQDMLTNKYSPHTQIVITDSDVSIQETLSFAPKGEDLYVR